MILKNKLTRESLEITYPEFRKSLQKKSRQLLKVIAEYSYISIIISLKMSTQ